MCLHKVITTLLVDVLYRVQIRKHCTNSLKVIAM